MTNIGDGLRATNEADSIDSNCWFCKTGSAAQGSSHKVDLHRVLARKSSYVVVGVQYRQQYETTTSRVPRCARCQSVHENVGRIFLLVWIAIAIWGFIWLIRDSGKGYDESVWEALFAVATMFLVCCTRRICPDARKFILEIGGLLFWPSESTEVDFTRLAGWSPASV